MKILVTIGTRPEAIKMAPLINRLKRVPSIETKVCNTGQHKHLVIPIFDFFGIQADFSIDTMIPNQGLHGLTAAIIEKTKLVFDEFQPDYVLIHGDTTTSFASALSAFYSGCKVAHVEAGLRTYNKLAPFPEEMNRTLNSQLADIHFAPTQSAAENLGRAGIIKNVLVTGNTVIDALLDAIELVNENDAEIQYLKQQIDFTKKIILFTGHRRENFGKGFDDVFSAVKEITESRDDIMIIYPVHPNPNVKLSAEKYFESNNQVKLIRPLSYGPFVWLMQKCHLILTDSGGIQEEAPSLGKPVLVLRELTERPEAVAAGTVIVVGTNQEKIISCTNRLLDDQSFYKEMTSLVNPYGDGKASERIIEFFTQIAAI